MAGMVGAARAGFGAIGSAAKGLAVGGLAVLGRGLKGLMAMLGGPWGAAIIAAVAAIWGFNQLIKQHDEEVKKATQDVKGWYLAIAKGGPDASAALDKLVKKQHELNVAMQKLRDLQDHPPQSISPDPNAVSDAIAQAKQRVADLTGELKKGYDALTRTQKLQVQLNVAVLEYGKNSPQAAAAARALNDAQNAQATADSKAKYALEGLNGELHKNIDLQLAAVDQQLGAQSAVLSAQSAIESYKSALKDSNATDVEKAQAQNSMAQAITQAVEQTEAAVVANEKSVDPQKRAADATAAARTVFDQLTKSVGGVPPELQGLANTLDGATTSSLGDTSTQLSITSGDVGNLGKSFSTMTKNDVLQVTVPGLSKMSDTLNGPTVSALTNGQSMSAKLGQAFINVKDKITTVFIPGLGTMQGNLNGPTVNALLTTIAKTGNATDAIGYLASAVKNLPKGTVIDIGADTSAAKNSLDTLITSYGKVTYTGSSIIVNGRVIANAEGNLLSRATPMRGDVATVVPKDTPRLIGDNMTSAEAFIPINGSPRSHKILSATAGQMGYGLVPMASGGIAEPIRWPAWRPPHETFPVRWQPGFLDTIAKDMVALQNAAKATAAAGGAVGSADVMQALSAAASAYGWSTGVQWQDLLAVIRRESGFNPRAQNPTSSAAGLGQFITSTWDAYRPAAASGYPTMKSAPVMYQAQAIMRYIRQVYGTPAGAEHSEQTRGWYDNGGLWPSGTTGVNTTGDIERVLAPPQDDYFRRFVDAAESMLHGKNQPTQLVGDLYLDSGEFLGKVRGVATAVLDARDATDARNLRSARL